MAPHILAFTAALLSYNARIPEMAMARVPGDRHLFAMLLSRVILSERDGRTITANKLAADAVAAGISGRTAIRLCREMMDAGYLNESAGRGLTVTPRGEQLWSENIEALIEELRRAGFAMTK